MGLIHKGPSLNSVTEFKYCEGRLPHIEYADGREGKWPYCLGAKHLGIKSNDIVKVRPSNCFKGIFFPSHNYELFWAGKWHRVQLITE